LLHYKAIERDDTPFWRHCRSMELTDTLRERWEMYQRTANIVVALEDLFKESSWFAVFTGQGVEPSGYHPFANIVSDEELQRRLDLISADVMKRVSTLPPHDEYIRQHCAALGVS
jgi:tryptophan halogenase